jgi:hypothetical protein
MAGALTLAAGIAAEPITPFSSLAPGSSLPGWDDVRLQGIKPNTSMLVADEGVTVLRIRSEASAGTLVHPAGRATRPGTLSWRWKVDHVVEAADMTRKGGDDFAARVYVFFDVPVEDLTFIRALRIRIARAIYGRDVPTAAICYVWDNRHPRETTMPNPYTERVRMIVLETGGARAGSWVEETRDLSSDYRRAFDLPAGASVPPLKGVGVGADTDQTGDSVTAWFGDFRVGARP